MLTFFLHTGQVLVIFVNQFWIQFRWNECPHVNLIWLLNFVQEQSMHFPILKFAIFLKIAPILMRLFSILHFIHDKNRLSDFQNKWVIKTDDSSSMMFWNIPAISWIWSGKLQEILFISETCPHSEKLSKEMIHQNKWLINDGVLEYSSIFVNMEWKTPRDPNHFWDLSSFILKKISPENANKRRNSWRTTSTNSISNDYKWFHWCW